MGGNLVLAAVGACSAVLALLLFRAAPRATVIAWALALFFLPVWVGANVGFFWSVVTAITLLAVVAGLSDIRLHPVDAVMAVFVTLIVALFAMKGATLSATVIALLEWVLPYVWGRLVLARVSADFVVRVLAAAATAAAVLAVIEFATGTNVFSELPPLSESLYAEWGPLQIRGGLLRVEGAWGHSIAFGAAMAMTSAFLLVVPWPVVVRLLALAAVASATVMTFSRIGIITLVLTVALGLVLLPGIPTRLRWWVIGGGLAAAVAVVPFIGSVFLDAGDEAGGSADYRGGLFALISQVQLMGTAGDWTGLTVGGDYLGSYANSVDNAFLVFALRFGWLPSLALMAALLLVAVMVLRRRTATPAAVAVAAQLPTMFAVALITQFGMYLWFLVGLAVAWRDLRASGGDGADLFGRERGALDAPLLTRSAR